MITTGIIREINLSTSSYSCNKYLIELNIFQIPGDKNKNNYVYKANCSTLPGHYDSYEVGDKVYVAFLNNDLSLPIIIGKIYQGKDSVSRSKINCQNFEVRDTAILSKNTKIGDISYDQLAALLSDKPLKYYNHIIKCRTDDNKIIKFKLLNRYNFNYKDLSNLINDLLFFNDDCSILADIYEDEDTNSYLTTSYLRLDENTIGAYIIQDNISSNLTDIIDDKIIEI